MPPTLPTPKQQFFTPVSDINFFRQITLEASDLFFREIEFRVPRDPVRVDKLYGEAKNIEYDVFLARAQTELTPKKATLTKFGLNEERSLMISIDTGIFKRGTGPTPEGEPRQPFCEEDGGYPIPDVGTLVVVQGDVHKITDNIPEDYFWHTEDHLSYTLFAIRYHDRSIDDAQLVDPENPAGPREVPTYHEHTDFPGEDS